MPSGNEICVDPTDAGIGTGRSLVYDEAEPTEDIEGDSKTDENLEILALERRDFDDEEGIEEEE
jgi:hypothetical protein